MSTLHANHPGVPRSGHLITCTCTACGHVLQVACPQCAAPVRPARPAPAGPRADQVTALLVDAVISASMAEGTAYAAQTLCENGVPFDVALRVLTRPESRRYHPVTLPPAAPRRSAAMPRAPAHLVG